MNIKKDGKRTIMILANKYPNKFEPNTNMFINQLASEFADLNFNTIVVCPMPINVRLEFMKLPYYSEEFNELKNTIYVYRPKYISFGQSGKFMQKIRVRLTTFFYGITVIRIIKKMHLKINFIYSYFLCPTSVVAAKISQKYHIPSFMEHGEALYAGDKKYGNKYLKNTLKSLNGVIAVSEQNRDYLINSNVIDSDKIIVFPNCFREERFYKIDKKIARQKMGWDMNKFIVGYAGSLDERKGVLRIEKAVDLLDDVYFAVAGSGNLIPTSSKCIFCKEVNHDKLVYFYNSLDVFLLPTLAEGSCTATAEAIGCGCPIISSNRSFNKNLCDRSNSLLVNPTNILEISSAIDILHKNPNMQMNLSLGSIEKAKTLKQKDRMIKIVRFLEERS